MERRRAELRFTRSSAIWIRRAAIFNKSGWASGFQLILATKLLQGAACCVAVLHGQILSTMTSFDFSGVDWHGLLCSLIIAVAMVFTMSLAKERQRNSSPPRHIYRFTPKDVLSFQVWDTS